MDKNIKFYKLQKILIFIPILNLFTFFIWGFNVIKLKTQIKFSTKIIISSITFIFVYVAWRFLSSALMIATYCIGNEEITILLNFGYYYFLGIVFTVIWIISEKQFFKYIKK